MNTIGKIFSETKHWNCLTSCPVKSTYDRDCVKISTDFHFSLLLLDGITKTYAYLSSLGNNLPVSFIQDWVKIKFIHKPIDLIPKQNIHQPDEIGPFVIGCAEHISLMQYIPVIMKNHEVTDNVIKRI